MQLQMDCLQDVGFYVTVYCCEQLSNKTTSDATLDGQSVGWTQDGPDYSFYATVYCCEQVSNRQLKGKLGLKLYFQQC